MTHDMVVRSGYATARTRMMEPSRRICVPIPLYHAFAYIEGLMAAITVGGALLLFREHFQVGTNLASHAGKENQRCDLRFRHYD